MNLRVATFTERPFRDDNIAPLLHRVRSEFLEMPGLRLTSRQAQRLWSLDQLVCESLLAALVDVHFLVERDGVYVQRTEMVSRLRHVARLG